MVRAVFFVEKWWNRWVPIIKKLKANPRMLIDENLCLSKDSHADYTSLISILRFGSTSKTTLDNRHAQTNEYLSKLDFLGKKPRVLDIGASDGITSLNLMRTLAFKFDKFYITDFNLEAVYTKRNGFYYLFNSNTGECVFIFNEIMAFKPNISKAIHRLFLGTIQKLQKEYKTLDKVTLLHPEVVAITKENKNIEVFQYDIFKEWAGEKVDIIKVANLLNRVYFSDEQITKAIENTKKALKNNGILCITHNMDKEYASIYKLTDDKLTLVHQINGGVIVQDLVS